MSNFNQKIDKKKYGLVNAVRVEPVAAATSFAWKTSMRDGEEKTSLTGGAYIYI